MRLEQLVTENCPLTLWLRSYYILLCPELALSQMGWGTQRGCVYMVVRDFCGTCINPAGQATEDMERL